MQTPYPDVPDDAAVRDGVKSGDRMEVSWQEFADKDEKSLNSGKALAALIEECWHQEPAKRPRMIDVVARLEALQSSAPIVLASPSHAGPGVFTMVRALVEEQRKARQAAERAAEYATVCYASQAHCVCCSAAERAEAAANPKPELKSLSSSSKS